MTESLIEAAYLNVGTKNTNHKSRIWRDIDKHPLPAERERKIDVKLECGSVLIGCYQFYDYISFGGNLLSLPRIIQWRDAEK